MATVEQGTVVDAFHDLYYSRGEQTWKNTHWLGVRAYKCPFDMWIYQEILWNTQPDVIVEAGTAWGGSALFLASMCDLIGNGRVVTVDIGPRDPQPPRHPRITYLRGSSVASDIVTSVKAQIYRGDKVMVTLDSDHSKEHVLAELRAYSPLVTPGNYLVVEDTHVNGNPVSVNFGPGPMEAVEEFLEGNRDFEVDRSCEKFLLTMHPGGWLRRVTR